MTIKYQDFEIKVKENCFELYYIIPPKQAYRNKNGAVRTCHGYFTKLENCVDKIIKVELSTRNEIVDLRKFIELYRSLKEEIQQEINF